MEIFLLIILVIIIISRSSSLFRSFFRNGCHVCGRTESRYTWTSEEIPGKIFCTKACLNKFIKNPNIKQSASTSKPKELVKKRVYPFVLDIIGLQYMLRRKCSWCKSGHDARSKYEISHSQYPGKLFYSMDCYRSYNSFYKSNPSQNHKIKRGISLFGVSHHRLIGESDTHSIPESEKETTIVEHELIHQCSKDEIIELLIGKEFVLNGKKCTMTYGAGSAQTIWIIKKGIWGEHIIQAHKLNKGQLIDLYSQVY